VSFGTDFDFLCFSGLGGRTLRFNGLFGGGTEPSSANSGALAANKRTSVHLMTYQFRMYANIKGAQIEASLSTMKRFEVLSNLPQVIFSLGTAPE